MKYLRLGHSFFISGNRLYHEKNIRGQVNLELMSWVIPRCPDCGKFIKSQGRIRRCRKCQRKRDLALSRILDVGRKDQRKLRLSRLEIRIHTNLIQRQWRQRNRESYLLEHRTREYLRHHFKCYGNVPLGLVF